MWAQKKVKKMPTLTSHPPRLLATLKDTPCPSKNKKTLEEACASARIFLGFLCEFVF
jgi:hypothetical protein